MSTGVLPSASSVIRRVGGLEDFHGQGLPHETVIRRVGGLEVIHFDKFFLVAVIRRVGGLEDFIERL